MEVINDGTSMPTSFRLEDSDSLGPVSYTHLDVYKRQPQAFGRLPWFAFFFLRARLFRPPFAI